MAHPHSGKGCWYFITIYECALCSVGDIIRERRWTPKPKRICDCYEYIQQAACAYHFL